MCDIFGVKLAVVTEYNMPPVGASVVACSVTLLDFKHLIFDFLHLLDTCVSCPSRWSCNNIKYYKYTLPR